MHPAWTGVESSMPRFSRAFMISGERFNVSKRTPCVTSMSDFLSLEGTRRKGPSFHLQKFAFSSLADDTALRIS